MDEKTPLLTNGVPPRVAAPSMNIALRSVHGLLPGAESCSGPGSSPGIPGSELTNEDLAELMGEVRDCHRRAGIHDDRPISDPAFPEQRIGVRSRWILDAELSVHDMARFTARQALARARVDPATVRCVIVSSVSGESSVPSIASGVQGDLRLGHDVVAFDLSVGCSGFVVAVDVAARLLDGMPEGSTAVVVGAETMSRVIDAGDRNTCAIFGDGAGAVVLEKRGDVPPCSTRQHTSGLDGPRIAIRGSGNVLPVFRFRVRDGRVRVERDDHDQRHVLLDGCRVFRDMVQQIPSHIRLHCQNAGEPLESFELVALHQANQRMTAAIGAELGLAQIASNIERAGNTSSASVPLILSQLVQDEGVTNGARVLLCGFGSGYSIATASLSFVAA